MPGHGSHMRAPNFEGAAILRRLQAALDKRHLRIVLQYPQAAAGDVGATFRRRNDRKRQHGARRRSLGDSSVDSPLPAGAAFAVCAVPERAITQPRPSARIRSLAVKSNTNTAIDPGSSGRTATRAPSLRSSTWLITLSLPSRPIATSVLGRNSMMPRPNIESQALPKMPPSSAVAMSLPGAPLGPFGAALSLMRPSRLLGDIAVAVEILAGLAAAVAPASSCCLRRSRASEFPPESPQTRRVARMRRRKPRAPRKPALDGTPKS
jgi:hypothetical protein